MNKKYMIVLILIIGLIIGGGMGFYYGKSKGYDKGKNIGYEEGKGDGVKEGREQAQAEAEAQKKAEAEKAAQAINPFSDTTTANPFGKGVNPFDSVKLNPFK